MQSVSSVKEATGASVKPAMSSVAAAGGRDTEAVHCALQPTGCPNAIAQLLPRIQPHSDLSLGGAVLLPQTPPGHPAGGVSAQNAPPGWVPRSRHLAAAKKNRSSPLFQPGPRFRRGKSRLPRYGALAGRCGEMAAPAESSSSRWSQRCPGPHRRSLPPPAQQLPSREIPPAVL